MIPSNYFLLDLQSCRQNSFANGKKDLVENVYIKTNVLNFPGDPKEYPFDMADFELINVEDQLHQFDPTLHKVLKFRHNPSNKMVVIKYLPFSSENMDKLKKEVSAHKFASSSPYVVDFYGLCFHEEQALIVMELMDMSLRKLYTEVKKKIDHFPEELLGFISAALLNCLIKCKEMNLMHRDIKPHNVLINKNGEIKLCDFGEARIALDYATTNNVGTIAYWAPERFEQDSTYNEKAEVWSLGLTLAELVLGCHLFENELNRAKCQASEIGIRYIISKYAPFEFIEKVQKKIGHRTDFCHFLSLCIRGDVSERWTLTALQRTKWYKKYGCFDDNLLFDKIAQELDKIELNWPPNSTKNSLIKNDHKDVESMDLKMAFQIYNFRSWLSNFMTYLPFVILIAMPVCYTEFHIEYTRIAEQHVWAKNNTLFGSGTSESKEIFYNTTLCTMVACLVFLVLKFCGLSTKRMFQLSCIINMLHCITYDIAYITKNFDIILPTKAIFGFCIAFGRIIVVIYLNQLKNADKILPYTAWRNVKDKDINTYSWDFSILGVSLLSIACLLFISPWQRLFICGIIGAFVNFAATRWFWSFPPINVPIFMNFILDGPAIFTLYALLPRMFTPIELAFGWPLAIFAYYLSKLAISYLTQIISMSLMFTGVAILQALMVYVVYKYRQKREEFKTMEYKNLEKCFQTRSSHLYFQNGDQRKNDDVKMFRKRHEMFVDPKEEKKIRNRLAAEKYRHKKEKKVKELEEKIRRLEKEKLEVQNNFSRMQQDYNDLLTEKAQWLDLKFNNACCMMKCQNMENSCFQEKQEPINTPNHGSNLPELSDFATDEESFEFTSPIIEKTFEVLSKEWGSESILLPIYGNISV